MEKNINELNLSDLEAVVGGVDMTVTATVNKIPTGSMSGSMSGSVNQPPKYPAPTRPGSALTAAALI